MPATALDTELRQRVPRPRRRIIGKRTVTQRAADHARALLVSGCDEQPVTPSATASGMPPRVATTARPSPSLRIEDPNPGHRAHHEHIERLHQADPASRLKPVSVTAVRGRIANLPLSGSRIASPLMNRVGHLAPRVPPRPRGALTLVRERRDVADNRRAGRQPERAAWALIGSLSMKATFRRRGPPRCDRPRSRHPEARSRSAVTRR